MEAKNLLENLDTLIGLLKQAAGQCPQDCARFTATGQCVHVPKTLGPKIAYTKEFQAQRDMDRTAKIAARKATTEDSKTWLEFERDDWDLLPYKFGVVVWLDVNGRVLLTSKVADARRRHYNWARSGKPLWDEVKTIWFLHTGWYEEILAELGKLEKDVVITKEVLEKVVARAKPLELPEPPVGVGR